VVTVLIGELGKNDCPEGKIDASRQSRGCKADFKARFGKSVLEDLSFLRRQIGSVKRNALLGKTLQFLGGLRRLRKEFQLFCDFNPGCGSHTIPDEILGIPGCFLTSFGKDQDWSPPLL